MSQLVLIGLILASVSLNALAQILLRLGARTVTASEPGLAALLASAFQLPVLGGLACYSGSLLLWFYVLGRVEVSFAYPFLSLGFVLVALAGWQWLGEPMPLARVAGIGIIFVGVLVVARS
jgi:multidrug transporter EmrE-like cation transporter